MGKVIHLQLLAENNANEVTIGKTCLAEFVIFKDILNKEKIAMSKLIPNKEKNNMEK